MTEPQMRDDEMYLLLRHGKIDEFNQRVLNGESCDLVGADLRGTDLRGMNARGLDMSNCYLRQADLRGIDFSETNLSGVSINGAKISGALFPMALRADEILLSLTHGIRMRYMHCN